MKNLVQLVHSRYALCALAIGIAVGCGSTSDQSEISSPDPAAAEASNGFNPMRFLGLGDKPAPPPPMVVSAGQSLRVRTTSSLSTKSNNAGETFVGTLQDAVMDGERVALPAGSAVTGRVTFSDPGGRVKGVAKIGVELSQITTPNGEAIPLNTGVVVREARQTHTKDAQKIGIGAGAGAVIGAVAGGGGGAAKGAGVGAGMGTGAVLATRGDAAVIPAESVLTFKLSQAVTVQP